MSTCLFRNQKIPSFLKNIDDKLLENICFAMTLTKMFDNIFILKNSCDNISGLKFKCILPFAELAIDVKKIDKTKIKMTNNVLEGEIPIVMNHEQEYEFSKQKINQRTYKIIVPNDAIIEFTGLFTGKINCCTLTFGTRSFIESILSDDSTSKKRKRDK